jgi:Tol biopolymer transport system component
MCGGIICGLREGGGYLSWQNGRIGYVSYDGNGSGIYTSNPNGSGKIAFESERDGNSEIYTMNPNGMSVDRLTNNPTFDFEPDSHLSRPQ